MERRNVQLRIAGQTHRVVTTASDADLKRFVGVIEGKISEVNPRGRALPVQALLLAALALVHDLEEERARSSQLEARTREALGRLVERIDAALTDEGNGAPLQAPAP
jgi:cell division protein ZapA